MNDEPQILIIGAGPTGLMLTCQLAIRDVQSEQIALDHGSQAAELWLIGDTGN